MPTMRQRNTRFSSGTWGSVKYIMIWFTINTDQDKIHPLSTQAVLRSAIISASTLPQQGKKEKQSLLCMQVRHL